MNFPKNRHGDKRAHMPKHRIPTPKISWQLLGLPDPAEEQKSISIDEIRSQAVLLSSRGVEGAVGLRSSTPRAKGNGKKDHAKSRRGVME